MVAGMVLALLAGSLVSLQNIFNSRVNERVGSWTTTALVLGTGGLASLVLGLLLEGNQLFTLSHMQPWFWCSGLLGVGVVTCIMQAIRQLGPTYAVSIVLTSQLGSALLMDSLGWLGLSRIPFTYQHLLGVLVIAGGVVVFKAGGARQKQDATA
ncbi:DMT family transporter [Brevibacillus sp. GCM10020057]|uniref:DMT family transporter n=1 Tax=Brevibacillus sp. GCM10020057 TaxID=3317327 RepID=UPI0036456AE8